MSAVDELNTTLAASNKALADARDSIQSLVTHINGPFAEVVNNAHQKIAALSQIAASSIDTANASKTSIDNSIALINSHLSNLIASPSMAPSAEGAGSPAT